MSVIDQSLMPRMVSLHSFICVGWPFPAEKREERCILCVCVWRHVPEEEMFNLFLNALASMHLGGVVSVEVHPPPLLSGAMTRYLQF